MMGPKREYARESDVNSEGATHFQPGDKLEREIANIKEWMRDLDTKVDILIKDGCSHRGNDLSKLDRIERATDDIRTEASNMKESVHGLALSFEGHKTNMVLTSGVTDSKINNLKIGILLQCAILLLALVGFLVKEFVIPNSVPIKISESIQLNKDQVILGKDSFQELLKNRNTSK